MKSINDYDRNELAVTYDSKDQNWQDETTFYWFNVGNETIGVSDCNGEMSIVDEDCCPINTDDCGNTHLLKLIDLVTDEIRAI